MPYYSRFATQQRAAGGVLGLRGSARRFGQRGPPDPPGGRGPAARGAILHYNLACYECQLGDLGVAKARLRHAFNLDDRFRAKALEDEDLEPLFGH